MNRILVDRGSKFYFNITNNSTFSTVVNYPPKNYLNEKYRSFGDFVSTIGGYYSVVQLFTAVLISFFIFNELNNFMAKRYMSIKYPEFDGSEVERKAI